MTATTAEPEMTDVHDVRRTEVFPLPTDEGTLLRLCRLLFIDHAHEICFGPCIEGAVFEIRPDRPAEVTMLDGYLTADFGRWHLHLCIGDHRGTKARPCPPELARHRRCARAELYRNFSGSCAPGSWGMRLFNGAGEQMITFFLPNPYHDHEGKGIRPPDFTRLGLWDELRREFLGLEPDPRDREGRG
jgi:hypothetical protein